MGFDIKSGWWRGKTLWVFLFAVVVVGLALRAYFAPGSHGPAFEVTDSTFEKEVLQSEIPVLVDFWAVWCGPCRMVSPMVDKMAGDYKGKIKVAKVDVDHNPLLSRKFNVQAIPTLLIFKKGVVIKSWVGLMPEQDLRAGILSSL